MPMVKTKDSVLEVEIFIERERDIGSVDVDRLFDANGSETFDLTDAVEVDVRGELYRLRTGDLLTMQIQVGSIDRPSAEVVALPPAAPSN